MTGDPGAQAEVILGLLVDLNLVEALGQHAGGVEHQPDGRCRGLRAVFSRRRQRFGKAGSLPEQASDEEGKGSEKGQHGPGQQTTDHGSVGIL